MTSTGRRYPVRPHDDRRFGAAVGRRLVHGEQLAVGRHHRPRPVAGGRRQRPTDGDGVARGRRRPSRGTAPAPRRAAAAATHSSGGAASVDGERLDGRAAQVAQVGARIRAGDRGRRRACGRTCRRRAVDLDRAAPGTRRRPTRRRRRSDRRVTGRGARSISMPSGPASCRRRPSTWSADTIGGTCSMSPSRCAATTARARRRAIDAAHVVDRGHDAVGVERVGLDAEHDLAGVALATLGDEAQQAGHHARRRRREPRWRPDRASRRGRCDARRGAGAACRRRRGSSLRPACRRPPAPWTGRRPRRRAIERVAADERSPPRQLGVRDRRGGCPRCARRRG